MKFLELYAKFHYYKAALAYTPDKDEDSLALL